MDGQLKHGVSHLRNIAQRCLRSLQRLPSARCKVGTEEHEIIKTLGRLASIGEAQDVQDIPHA